MVAIKSAVLFALFSFAANVIATPPACLLAAVNGNDDPSDLKSLCGDGAKDIQSALAQGCGSNADSAQKAFIASCKEADITVGKSHAD